MKNILITILTIVLSTAAFEQTAALAQTAPKDADAIYESIVHEYVLNVDGSVRQNYEHRLKLLTSYAFSRAYGESFIVYNPKWQKLEILKSETRMANGTMVESPFNAYNEVLPRFAAGAAPYLNLLEMVVTHTGLEKNAVVNFAYKIETAPGMYPSLVSKVLLGHRSPAMEQKVIVRIPATAELNYALLRSDVEATLSENDGWKAYTWIFGPIDAVAVEAGQPAMDLIVPVLYFTTASEDEAIDHALSAKNIFKLTPEAASLTRELIAGKKTPVAKAMALQKHVAENVGQMSGDLSFLGYQAMPASLTFEKNVGSDLDRAVLLAAMCREAGLKADPVLFGDNTRYRDMTYQVSGGSDKAAHQVTPRPTPDIVTVSLYDNPAVICAGINFKAGALVLDPSHSQHSPWPSRYANKFYFALDHEREHPLYYAGYKPATERKITADYKLTDDGELSGSIEVAFDNTASYSLDGSSFKKQLSSKLRVLGKLKQAKVDSCFHHPDGQSDATVNIMGEVKFNEITGLAQLSVPQAPGGIADRGLALADVRRSTPIQLEALVYESCRVKIDVPDNVVLQHVPAPIIYTNSVGSVKSIIRQGTKIIVLTQGLSRTLQNNSISVVRRLEIERDNITPAQFEDFRKLVAAWQDPAHNVLLLRKKMAPGDSVDTDGRTGDAEHSETSTEGSADGQD